MPESRTLVIAGASGVVGRHLIAVARASGWRVRCLTRSASPVPSADVEWVSWRPDAARTQDTTALEAVRAALEGASAVVNLAGATLAEGRLSESLKTRVLHSRLDATTTLVAGLRRCDAPPGFWLQASATGYYGDAGERDIVESDPPADDFFLAEVCQQWEAAAKTLITAPGPDVVRLAVARLGLVLAPDAPAWQKLIGPVKWGVGGRLGSGEQWWAWIDADDVARAVLYLADHPSAEGTFNFTAPEPLRQVDLTKRTAKRLGRPAFFPAPAFVLRLALGESADALLLPSCKARPARLQEAGFEFVAPDFETQLDRLLGDG